jgi:hypothetical protein
MHEFDAHNPSSSRAMSERPHEPPLRPADFARIALASSSPGRMRARDQQADVAGDDLRRQVLNRLIVLDPEPEELESTLLAIVVEMGEPTGPVRGVCTAIAQEWEQVRPQSEGWRFLIDEAIRQGATESTSRRTAPGTDEHQRLTTTQPSQEPSLAPEPEAP